MKKSKKFVLYETPKKIFLFQLKKDVEVFKELERGDFDEFKTAIKLKDIFEFEDLRESKKYFLNIENKKLPKGIEKFLIKNGVKAIYTDKILTGILRRLDFQPLNDVNIFRCIQHFQNQIFKSDFLQTYLGLSHLISRKKISAVIGREDNLIIQSVIMIDQLDKEINLYSARLKELYGWYFPELERLKSTTEYIVAAYKMGKIRSKSGEEVKRLSNEVNIEESIIYNSIGVEISELDWDIINNLNEMLNQKVLSRTDLEIYLKSRMRNVAPNLSVLIGDLYAARLIQYSGSLNNLAMSPCSTIQLLGAEKALFRSLKTKSVTPKYGIIYSTDIVQSVKQKFRGRMARNLASKCALLARIDSFSEDKTDKYGQAIREMLKNSSEYYEKNIRFEKTHEIFAKIKNKSK